MKEEDGIVIQQQDELEALKAILDTDFQVGKDNLSERLVVKLYFRNDFAEFNLVLFLPSAYPDECPHLTIESIKGFPLAKRSQLLIVLSEEAQSQKGYPMIFELYTKTKEWLEDNLEQEETEDDAVIKDLQTNLSISNGKSDSYKEKVMIPVDASLRDDEFGTPVTRETFEKWRQKFMEEMFLKNNGNERSDGAEEKLTGRQLFEQMRVNITDESFYEYDSDSEDSKVR
eukprot:jgi/Galph1/3942/GphlegSOOS_G2611.1